MKINYRKLLFSLLLILLLLSAADAQKLLPSGQKIMKMPKNFEAPTLSEYFDPGKENETNTDWVVYSDRDNNNTYSSANESSETVTTINFMDKFYVIGYSGEFLHLAKYDPKVTDINSKTLYKVFKQGGVDMGWVKKSKLLLWYSAIYNDRNFKIKALAAIKDSATAMNVERFIKRGGLIILYNGPQMFKPNDQQVNIFQFLYVYKQSNDRWLVGKSDKFNTTFASEILGWVDKDIIIPWGDRICLEPNTSSEAVQERKSKKIDPALFSTYKSANNFYLTGVAKEPVWSEPYETPKKPQWKRFPILGGEGNIIKTGRLSDISDKEGEATVDLDEQAASIKAANNKIAEMRNINLIFVVDGSLSDYTVTITDAINKIKNQNNNSDIKSNINYGAVVYRDYKDESCDENRSFKKQSLTASINTVINFIDKQLEIKGCTDSKTEVTQAVRLGLSEALKMLSDVKRIEQSNFIVLIGGAGDMPEDKDSKIKTDQLAKMMAEVQSNLMVFQVTYGDDNTFKFFSRQNKDLFDKAVLTLQENMHKTHALKDKKFIQPKWQLSDKLYRINWPQTSSLLGSIIFPTRGEIMSTEVLTSELDNRLDTILNVIERKVLGVEAIISGIGGKNLKEPDPSTQAILYSIFKSNEIPPKVSKALMEENYQFFINAYASIECSSLKYPVYKRVLFISDDEYQDLKTVLGKLTINEGDDNDQRILLQNAFKGILETYLGPTESKRAINTMTTDQILELATGLKSKNSIFSQITIGDILKKEKLNQEKLSDLLDYIGNKLDKLKNIKNDPDFCYLQFGSVYYWVPEEFLP